MPDPNIGVSPTNVARSIIGEWAKRNRPTGRYAFVACRLRRHQSDASAAGFPRKPSATGSASTSATVPGKSGTEAGLPGRGAPIGDDGRVEEARERRTPSSGVIANAGSIGYIGFTQLYDRDHRTRRGCYPWRVHFCWAAPSRDVWTSCFRRPFTPDRTDQRTRADRSSGFSRPRAGVRPGAAAAPGRAAST